MRPRAVGGVIERGVEQGAAATTTTDAAAAAAAAEAFEDVEMCLVCTDDCEPGDELIVLTCHHSFHADCIKRWLKVNAVCPACRARVTRVSGRERAALWRSRWGVDDAGIGAGTGLGIAGVGVRRSWSTWWGESSRGRAPGVRCVSGLFSNLFGMLHLMKPSTVTWATNSSNEASLAQNATSSEGFGRGTSRGGARRRGGSTSLSLMA